MEDLPVGLSDDELAAGLARFGVTGTPVYAPLGFGDYHWSAGDHFTSVADLTAKPLDGLRQAMETTASLSALPFVVAPLRADDGETVVLLNGRYALSVFPFVAGEAGTFGNPPPAGVNELLAELHACSPPPHTPAAALDLPGRATLAALLDDPGEWFSTSAREIFVAHAEVVRARLTELDRLAAALPPERVVTHGEPHAGNVIRTADGLKLVDWDTVGLAPPERDLWLTGGQSPFYALRWSLDDIAQFIEKLRAPHERSRDAELSMHYFRTTLEAL
ncbi:phosphotransferase family protein [Lentzea sp. NPDC058450]|uniref:phosphotransferase family protein n=1 Tax=Lentzea sp. NPDC058450 TaxID=3346505 RepID=UPI00364CA964